MPQCEASLRWKCRTLKVAEKRPGVSRWELQALVQDQISTTLAQQTQFTPGENSTTCSGPSRCLQRCTRLHFATECDVRYGMLDAAPRPNPP